MSGPFTIEKRPPAGTGVATDTGGIVARLAALEATAALREPRGHARMIAVKIESIDEALQQLCESTCPDCPDPCCARATICYDRRDLLFYTLHVGEPPVRQTLKESGGACIHLGKDGCVLPRSERPFVCTWYLCPPQKQLLRRLQREERIVDVESVLEEIKTERGMLEQLLR